MRRKITNAGILPATAMVLIALLVGAVGIWIGFTRLLRDAWPWQLGGLETTTPGFQLMQLVLTLIGGIGAAILVVVAYRRQRDLETARFDDRFAAAAAQLGADTAAERLAGVYAMAALADTWRQHRQQCIDVLCGYLRLPYDPAEGLLAEVVKERTWPVGEADKHGRGEMQKETRTYRSLPNDREVRHTIIRVITEHLRDAAPIPWHGHDFDFTGAVFDGGDFTRAIFAGGQVSFDRATFSGGLVSFLGATFSGGQVSFAGASFSGGQVSFGGVKFSGGTVGFAGATFSGGQVNFFAASFSGGRVGFAEATFSGGQVNFGVAFPGGLENFLAARFSGGDVSFAGASFSGGQVNFVSSFSGGLVSFLAASFSGGKVNFVSSFSGSYVSFDRASFSGGQLDFCGADFPGGTMTLDESNFGDDARVLMPSYDAGMPGWPTRDGELFFGWPPPETAGGAESGDGEGPVPDRSGSGAS